MPRPAALVAVGLVAILAVAPTLAVAQDTTTGRISGRVLSALAGEGIPSAQVTVEGTAITALTNWAGKYTLENVPVGTVKSRMFFESELTIVRPRNATASPAGEKRGWTAGPAVPVRRRGAPPSGATTQMSLTSSWSRSSWRALANAIHRPSGDQTGSP